MKLERLAPDSKALKFRFDPSVLDRLTSIYEDVVEPKLDLATLRTSGAHDKLRGDGLSFHVTPYGSLLAWAAADDLTTHREFQRLFDQLGLAAAVMPLVDWHERIVMYQGFFIVSDGVADASWHVDYFEGSHAYTLLTPLYELDADHGHLWYSGSDGRVGRYDYQLGVGVLVGEGFLHSTEPFAPQSGSGYS